MTPYQPLGDNWPYYVLLLYFQAPRVNLAGFELMTRGNQNLKVYHPSLQRESISK